jgi:hypothetical protein
MKRGLARGLVRGTRYMLTYKEWEFLSSRGGAIKEKVKISAFCPI